jgi:copper homeostasis protein
MNIQDRYVLEVCTASVADCSAAAAGGADRIELNTALDLGGLTPSLGLLVEARRAVSVPLIAMMRPRPGGFCYDAPAFATLQRDVDLALSHGADGIAFGFLLADGTLDVDRCRRVVRQAERARAEVVFHRAFDVVPDPERTLDALIDLGVTRILTSGQAPSAPEGARRIARWIERAAGRIEILPAGGIRADTVGTLLAETGCTQVHAGLTMRRPDPSTQARPHLRFGGTGAAEDGYTATNPDAVAALRAHLDAASATARASFRQSRSA